MIGVNQSGSPGMQTTSETVLLITVWTLTLCGLFFGTRAKLRKRRMAKENCRQDAQK
jgi:hypothetical protein